MTTKKTGILVISYNVLSHMKRIVSQLALSDSVPYELLVIDNASSDGSIDWVSENVDHIILNKENTGYTKAANQGILYFMARDDISNIILLNPDINLTKNWLTPLNSLAMSQISQMSNLTSQSVGSIMNRVGVIGNRQIRGQEVIHGGGRIEKDPRPRYEVVQQEILPGCFINEDVLVAYMKFSHRMGHAVSNSWHETSTIPWVTFACVLLKKEMIGDIGLLDERYFNRGSDVEYCARAWSRGWEVWYEPQSTIYHFAGQSERVAPKEVQQMGMEDLRLLAREEAKLIPWIEDNFVYRLGRPLSG